jgi:hypothetical protein
MGTLRYASAGPERLYDAIEERYFITERLAAERTKQALEQVLNCATAVQQSIDIALLSRGSKLDE